MGSIFDKIEYTVQMIEDIRAAFQEKGIDTSNVPGNKYGDLIRSMSSSMTYDQYLIVTKLDIAHFVPIESVIYISNAPIESTTFKFNEKQYCESNIKTRTFIDLSNTSIEVTSFKFNEKQYHVSNIKDKTSIDLSNTPIEVISIEEFIELEA